MQEFAVLLELDYTVALSLGALLFAMLLCPFWLLAQKDED